MTRTALLALLLLLAPVPLFAQEHATLTARRLDPGPAGRRQTWRCEVVGERGRAAVFELTVELRRGAGAALDSVFDNRLTGS